MKRTLVSRDHLLAGLAAGLAGAVLIDAFYFAVAAANGTPLPAAMAGTYAFISSVAFPAGGVPAELLVPFGIVAHLFVSLAWAYGYVYLVRSQPQLLTRPIVSGLGFGIVVYTFMNLIVLAAGKYHRPGPVQFEIDLIAHVLFFGVPVALIVSSFLRPRSVANS